VITISPRAREIAENLNMNAPRRPGEQCLVTPRYAAIIADDPDPHRNVVQRLRLLPEEVAGTVAEVRALYAARGLQKATWEVSNNATPGDLGERLAALGMEPFQPEPLSVGMVLARPLDHTAGDVVIREVTTLDDYRLSAAIFTEGFGIVVDGSDPEAVARSYERSRTVPGYRRYLAFVGGEPVAAADAVYLDEVVVMCGGATLPRARGKGAYRALIAARWEEGRRRGVPVLVTQAGSMSRPILRRLGFEEVVQIQIYLDSFG
jgi:GNAT superfamily N-acetyltransferase